MSNHDITCWMASDGVSKWNNKKKCFDIHTCHALIQLAGYIKYKLNDEVVLFRGQKNNYGSIEPSLYRRVINKQPKIIQDSCARSKLVKDLNKIKQVLYDNNFFIKNIDFELSEPIMQHYGFNTRYVDFVDNIWVALAFSVLSYQSGTKTFADNLLYIDNKDYGYLYIVSLGKYIDKHHIITDKNYEIIDLRKSIPSLYLRPHAQHGVLARKIEKKGGLTTMNTDMYNDVVAMARIKKKLIIEWINESKILTSDFLFPSPFFDLGYATMLDFNISNIYKEMIKNHIVNHNNESNMKNIFGSVVRYTSDRGMSDYTFM